MLFFAPTLRAADAPPHEISSGPKKVRLIELYSSQSRASCPPAERWFSSLREHPSLWQDIVPVSFHVSYWDKRGWKDRLALPEFTARMQGWLSRWRSSTPYAPVIVLDGVEWSGWAKEEPVPMPAETPAGILTVKRISEAEFRVLYQPDESARGPWTVHGALLGLGVRTRIEAGENIGKTLYQDFVALRSDQKPMESTREGYRATVRLPFKGGSGTVSKDGLALAVWVSRQEDLLPVQAAGTVLVQPQKN